MVGKQKQAGKRVSAKHGQNPKLHPGECFERYHTLPKHYHRPWACEKKPEAHLPRVVLAQFTSFALPKKFWTQIFGPQRVKASRLQKS